MNVPTNIARRASGASPSARVLVLFAAGVLAVVLIALASFAAAPPAEATGPYQLQLIRIHVIETEDSTWDHLLLYANGALVYEDNVANGETVDLTGIGAKAFDDQMTLALWEEDDWSSNDHLGSHTVYYSGGGEESREFKAYYDDGTSLMWKYVLDFRVVDPYPPNTEITSGPSGMVNTDSAVLEFASDEPDVKFEGSLDSGTFTGVSSPHLYTGLSEGRHTFQVKAIDTHGSADRTPAYREWTVDKTAPDTAIDSGPSGYTNSTSATFSWSGTDNLASAPDLVYSYRLDGGSWSAYTAQTTVTFDGLAQGERTFEVKAKDVAGNEEPASAAATRKWTVDKSAPTTSATVSAQPNANGWHNQDVSITLKATDEAGGSGIKEITYSATGAQQVGETKVLGSSTQLAISTEGQTTISYFATDNAGNAEQPPKTLTIKMNKSAPKVVSVTPPTNATVVAPETNVTATFSEDMMASSINATTFKLFKKGSTTKLSAKVSYDAANHKATLDPTNYLRLGSTYKAVVTTGAKDLAGTALDQNPSVGGAQQRVWYFTIRR
jgi:hypothetical protein